MGLNIFTLGSSKTYTRESLLGGGAVVGKNVTVSSITPIDGGNRVTFSYTLDDGTVKTSTMDVMDGKDGIDGTNGKNGKDGQPGKDGTDGIGISKIEKIGTVDLVDTYRITFTDNSTFDYEVTNGADGQGGTGASTWSEISDKPFESLSTDFSVENGELKVVDGTGGGEENVQSDWNETDDTADGFIKNKPTIPTKVSQLENDSNYLSSIPEEYVTETELSAKGYLTEHQDISGKVDKVDGKSLIADTEIERLASVDNYDDTQVKTQIQAVANGLMDSVGYSADYKTIDIIAKNGVKKSVNVAPIISHASITELSDVDTTNKATGKALVYNATTSKHEYADVSGTDEKVKMDSSTDAKYLGELLDNITIANENGKLKVKKLDGQEVTITEINYLKGLTMNVMDLVNMFSNGGVKIINTPVATYAELLTLDKSSFIEGISYLIYVLADENHDNAKTTYLVDKDSETPTYFGFADSQRDFVTNPIDLATEITGKLGIANMDSDAIKALFTVDDTYKTETTTNNAFSTHGAKALYDELLLAIGNKANSSDLTAHKDDTDIHVSTEDRTKWDSAKTHADSAHAPSNAQENIIESVKINDQEITPDENKAVNIDLTGYAEHDEIVGENLIPFPYAQPERTTNGITFTFADDGSVIANGTATENADFSVCVRTNFGTDAALMLKPGIYAITGCPEGGSDSTYRIQVQFGDKTELKYNLKADYGKGFVFEVTEEYAQYACQIQCHVQKGYTVTDLVFKPMLVLGSVLKEYQPYKLSRESLRTDIADVTELASRVDNQFSIASGDYITVNDSVDGNIVELNIKGKSIQNQYTGKNLITYPFSQTTQTKYGVTFTDNKNGSINISGTQDGSTTRPYMGLGIWWNETNKKTGNIPIPANTDFTISSNCGSNTAGLRYYIYDESGAKLADNTVYGTSTKTLKFDVEVWVALCVETAANGAVYSCECKPQLELGTTATEYEPYVGCTPAPNPSYPQEIKSVGDDGSLVVKSCGKNLIPYPYYNGSDTRNGITATVNNNDGSITLNGTATNNYFFVLLHRDYNGKGFARQFRGKTVTISGGTASPVLSFAVYDENGNNITPLKNEMVYDFGSGITVIIPDNACDIYSYYYCSSGVTINKTFKPQLEVGEVITKYEPYKSSTTTISLSEPLRAIGDVKDEITYQDGKWGVLRRTGKYVIDGTENLVLDSSHISDCGISVRMGNYTSILKGISTVSGNIRDMVTDYLGCRELDHVPYYDSSSTIDYGSGIYRTAGNVWLTFGASDIEKMGITKDVDSVKTWLSSHNITVHYPLGTPTFEPFADQTLPYLSTYNGVTNISNDDALSAEMTVKYPTTDASGVGSRNESRIAELAKDTDDKFDEVNESLGALGKCKNLLKPTLQTVTQDGITCTDNGDGTYTLNGTCSVDSTKTTIILTSKSMKIDEDVKFICCTQSGSSDTFRASVDYDDGTYSVDYGEGTLLSKGKTITKVSMIVSNGATVNNLVFKPMLTTNLNATYDDFVPYTGDGETLASDVAEIKNDLGGLSFSASGTTLTITDGTNTWTLGANS